MPITSTTRSIFGGGRAAGLPRRSRKETVAPYDQFEQLWVFSAATAPQPALAISKRRFHVADERAACAASSVGVGRESATDGEAIGPGLLLSDSPRQFPFSPALTR